MRGFRGGGGFRRGFGGFRRGFGGFRGGFRPGPRPGRPWGRRWGGGRRWWGGGAPWWGGWGYGLPIYPYARTVVVDPGATLRGAAEILRDELRDDGVDVSSDIRAWSGSVSAYGTTIYDRDDEDVDHARVVTREIARHAGLRALMIAGRGERTVWFTSDPEGLRREAHRLGREGAETVEGFTRGYGREPHDGS